MTNKAHLSNKATGVAKALALFLVIIFSIFTLRKTTEQEKPSLSQTSETDAQYCVRVSPYPMPAEFGRVFSLLLQRHQQKNIPQYMQLKSIANCLEIKYSDLSETGAEGVFYFDDRVSSANRLVVEVDATYSFTDDLTTAFLLSHELSHARQYTEELQGIKTWNCVDAEVDAFYSQLIFGSLLNEEESDSVISRIEKGSRNSQLLQYEDLLDLSWDAIGACNLANKSNPTQQDLDCYKQTLYQKLRQMVTSNPYYQDQCGITD